MFFTKFFVKKQGQRSDMEEKIIALQEQRNEAKEKIRKLRAESQLLVQQATEADDLDRKILSLDYEAKQAAIRLEEGHFADLSRMITQLQNIQAVQNREATISSVARISESIDADALIRQETELAARRDMMREDAETLDCALAQARPDDTGFSENEEFAKLVSQAKKQKVKAAILNTEECLKAAKAPEPVKA